MLLESRGKNVPLLSLHPTNNNKHRENKNKKYKAAEARKARKTTHTPRTHTQHNETKIRTRTTSLTFVFPSQVVAGAPAKLKFVDYDPAEVR